MLKWQLKITKLCFHSIFYDYPIKAWLLEVDCIKKSHCGFDFICVCSNGEVGISLFVQTNRQVDCCIMGYRSETHHKLKSHKTCLPITWFLVAWSFLNFAQSMAVILPCSVQNLKIIGQLKWMDKFWVLRWITEGNPILKQPLVSLGTNTLPLQACTDLPGPQTLGENIANFPRVNTMGPRSPGWIFIRYQPLTCTDFLYFQVPGS